MKSYTDLLATKEQEKITIEKFDAIYDVISDSAKLEVDRTLIAFQLNRRGLGNDGAKYLYMKAHEYLNMNEDEQKEANKHASLILSMME